MGLAKAAPASQPRALAHHHLVDTRLAKVAPRVGALRDQLALQDEFALFVLLCEGVRVVLEWLVGRLVLLLLVGGASGAVGEKRDVGGGAAGGVVHPTGSLHYITAARLSHSVLGHGGTPAPSLFHLAPGHPTTPPPRAARSALATHILPPHIRMAHLAEQVADGMHSGAHFPVFGLGGRVRVYAAREPCALY